MLSAKASVLRPVTFKARAYASACSKALRSFLCVFSISDRVAMLYEGKVLEVGTPDEMRKSKNQMVQQFVSGSPDGPIKFFQQKDDYLEQLMK